MTIKAPQAKTVLSEGFRSALPGALACIVNLRHELTHAPFIVCRPGVLEGGRRVPEPVSLCNVRPRITRF